MGFARKILKTVGLGGPDPEPVAQQAATAATQEEQGVTAEEEERRRRRRLFAGIATSPLGVVGEQAGRSTLLGQ